jgi:hypothetical protein
MGFGMGKMLFSIMAGVFIVLPARGIAGMPPEIKG